MKETGVINVKSPYPLKFMGETGFSLHSDIYRKREHAPMGVRAIKKQTTKQNPNGTLNLLLGLDGTVRADLVFGASICNTAEFLRFFSRSFYVNPVRPGDTIIVEMRRYIDITLNVSC